MKNVVFCERNALSEKLLKQLEEDKDTTVVKMTESLPKKYGVPGCRGVIAYDGSTELMQRHIDVVESFPFSQWIICPMAASDAVFRTVRSQCAFYFSKKNISYNCVRTVEELLGLLQAPVRTGRSLFIVSRDKTAAEKVENMISKKLTKWTVKIAVEDEKIKDCDAVVVVVYSADELLRIKLPDGISKKIIMVLSDFPLTEKSEKDFRSGFLESLSETEWTVGGAPDVYISSLKNEEVSLQLEENSETSKAVALRYDRDFVMWDCFGLPLKPEDYTIENILGFLKGKCFIQTIASSLDNV